MAVRKAISFEDITIEDATFIAKYQGKTLTAYIRKCVESENQKRLKSIKNRIDEELHCCDLISAPQRSGNESEVKKVITRIVEDILEERKKRKKRGISDKQLELLHGNEGGRTLKNRSKKRCQKNR